MAFPLYFTYHIRHHSCLNTQAGSNIPCCCSGIIRVLAGEKGPQSDKEESRKPQTSKVCLPAPTSPGLPSHSSHFTSLRTVTAPGLIILDFPPNKHPSAIHLPKANAANCAPETASELLKLLQTIYCKCQG